MGTTREEIGRWFDEGVAKGATHMIVATDIFDWDDYPVYVMPGSVAAKRADEVRSQSMTKVMEVYDLSMDRAQQLGAGRVYNV